MEKNIIIEGIVSATSDKQNADFASDEMRKSLYFTPKDEKERQKMLDYGLREYGEKEKFFIIKTSREVAINGTKIDCSVHAKVDANGKQVLYKGEPIYEGVSKNFSSDGKVVAVALFEGESKGNRFVRVYAIKGNIIPNEYDAFEEHKTDIEDVKTDANLFAKTDDKETVEINTDDLPF